MSIDEIRAAMVAVEDARKRVSQASATLARLMPAIRAAHDADDKARADLLKAEDALAKATGLSPMQLAQATAHTNAQYVRRRAS